MNKNYVLDSYVSKNFQNLNFKALFIPFFLLTIIAFFLIINGVDSVDSYTQIQKYFFINLNAKFSQFKSLQFNLTQLGDVLIFLPFLTIFIVYAPKFWQALLTALLLSSIISNLLKTLFSVPRPAAIFNNNDFIIIGEVLSGNTSLPSGHSIATFTILSMVFFAFKPKAIDLKIICFLFILISGVIIVFTRIGVGAHYPLDVVIGAIIGCTVAPLGVFLNRKFNPWTWIENKKHYYIFIFLISIWGVVLINKIIAFNLLIFYFALVSLLVTLFVITKIYVKK